MSMCNRQCLCVDIVNIRGCFCIHAAKTIVSPVFHGYISKQNRILAYLNVEGISLACFNEEVGFGLPDKRELLCFGCCHYANYFLAGSVSAGGKDDSIVAVGGIRCDSGVVLILCLHSETIDGSETTYKGGNECNSCHLASETQIDGIPS